MHSLPRDEEEVINNMLRDYKENFKSKTKKPFEMYNEEELPKYHQITLKELIEKNQKLIDDEEYRKYLIEKRKKQYSKFKVEYVENLNTGIEINFTDFEMPIKTKERGIER